MSLVPRPCLTIVLVSLVMLGAGQVAGAGPSVAELLSVCDRAFAWGNTGKDAAACEWYAVPCACKFRGPDAPRWCVPESESIENTVRKVLVELRRHPDPRAATDRVVPQILGRIYPCR
jgi:hypothetical protein